MTAIELIKKEIKSLVINLESWFLGVEKMNQLTFISIESANFITKSVKSGQVDLHADSYIIVARKNEQEGRIYVEGDTIDVDNNLKKHINKNDFDELAGKDLVELVSVHFCLAKSYQAQYDKFIEERLILRSRPLLRNAA